ncbi:alpha/beta hydrolase [Cryobacterium breve]|uniref:alpha/beta hydrolase n=1 Tax=Cryobacterium breve TaxID=1259258 RepID=UPI003D7C3478
MFPDKVGRLVLDGALDPSTSNAEVTRVQAVGFESALRSYLADCLGGSKCPFNGTVDQAMSTISALLDSVDRSPIAASDGRMLGGNTLLTAIIYPLYQASAWPNLSEMLSSVMQGNTKVAFQFADAYNGRNSDGSYLDNSTEAFLAINCLDYSYNDDPAVMRADAAAIEAAAPVIGKYMAYGDTGCANWPDKFTGTRAEIHAPGAAPILVVGTTNDPATPYVWAQSLAKQARQRPARYLCRRGAHRVQQVQCLREQRGGLLPAAGDGAGDGPEVLMPDGPAASAGRLLRTAQLRAV